MTVHNTRVVPDTIPTRVWPLVGATVAIATILSVLVSMSIRFGDELATRHGPLLDAATAIRLEAALAHLGLVEGLSGKGDGTAAAASTHLRRADGHARAMLQGGNGSAIGVAALEDPGLRQAIRGVRENLAVMGDLNAGWRGPTTTPAAVGALIQHHDNLFTAVMDQMATVHAALQRALVADRDHLRAVQAGLLAAVLAAAVLTLALLRRNERRWRAQVATLARAQSVGRLGSWSIHVADGTAELSEQAFRILGREPAPFVPERDAAAEWLHPDDHGRYRHNLARMLQLAPGETFPATQYRILRPDNEVRWVEITAEGGFDHAGHLTRLFGTLQDITERQLAEQALRNSEARLSTVIDTIPDLIWLKDAEGRYLACNPAFARFFGASEAEIVGKTDYDFVDRELADAFRANDHAAITAGAPRHNEEWITFAADGRRALLDTTKTPTLDADGRLVGVLGIGHDITESHRVQEALAAKELHYRQALQMTGTGTWEYDVDSGAVIWSAEVERIWGLPEGSFAGGMAEVTGRIHPDDLEAWRADVRVCIDEGRQHDLEFRVVHPDGASRWVHAIGDAQRDAGGRAVRLYGLVRDISDQKRALAALQKSEQRYRELVENMSDGVAVYEAVGDGEDFVFRDHNRAGERINSISRGEVIGRSVREVFPAVEDIGLLEVFRRVWRTGEPEHHPVSRYQDQQLELWVENYVFRLPGDEVVAVYRDVTEQRQTLAALRESEQALASTFRAAPIGIGLAVDRVFREVNEGLCRMTGYDRDQLLGQSVRMVYPDDAEYERVGREHYDQLRRGGSGRLEIHFRRSDGSIIDVLIRSAMLDMDDPAAGIAFTALDITERKNAEREIVRLNTDLERRVRDRTAELAAANERLKELDRLKSMFIASMSHELRTPLNSIIGFAGLLLMEPEATLTGTQRDFLRRVEGSGHHLLGLVSDVIDVSKIEAGKIDVYFESVKLGDVVTEAMRNVETAAADKRLRLARAVLDLELRTDRKRLLQCLINFLSNAVKYSESGEVRITADRDADKVTVRVEDQGIGIPADQLPRLFRPFSRIDSPLSRRTPGTGLGLYLTRKLAREVLGGDVGAESTPGAGSTFWITLPLEPDHETRTGH